MSRGRPAQALRADPRDHTGVSRPLLITVIGKSARDPEDPVPPQAIVAAEEVGRRIAEAGAIAVTGGLSGVMEAVSRGAKSAGGLVIGVLPGFDKNDANAYVDVAFTTGMGFMRNTLTVRAADAVIMISGGIGTLNELTVAYEDKPTVVLEGTGGWADRIRDIAYKGVHLEESGRRALHYAATPQEAVDLAVELAHTDARARRGGQLELR
ncbi:MAG: TIGR00725 family protein [Chloroflexi bacterium]|nr:TIGR00725 family protein [Chloroflexota bacterium]